MLLIAGLLGLMAVGTLAVIGPAMTAMDDDLEDDDSRVGSDAAVDLAENGQPSDSEDNIDDNIDDKTALISEPETDAPGTDPLVRTGSAPMDGGSDDNQMGTAGAEDTATLTDGAEVVILGDWSADDDTAIDVVDYDSEDDQLVIMCDFAGGTTPEIDVFSDEDGTGYSRIAINGTEILRVSGAPDLTAADLVLIDHGDAAAFGLAGSSTATG